MAQGMVPPQVRNLLFDLGGVHYAVDYPATVRAFAELAQRHGTTIHFSQAQQDPLFDRFEVGQIGEAEFLEGLRSHLRAPVPDAELIGAWNAMLGGLIPGRRELVRVLAERYPLALLSNTNAIHWEHRVGMEVGELLEPFGHVFLSYTAGLRKPNADFFEYALATTGWRAEETLFIEDTPQHIAAAQRLGLCTLHLTDPATLAPYFGL